MATIALGFNISASATGMAQGVNAAAVELEKLGLAAKKTASDVGVLKTLSVGRAFIDGIQAVFSTFSGFAQGAFDAVESTSNLSRELGISYSQLQELQIAASLAGVSTETLGKAFTKAQIAIAKASQGGAEAVKALSAIGLSAADFQGLSSSEQFTLIANAINGITDPAQRAAAAVAIFGKSGAELLPVFRELGGNLVTSQDFLAKFQGGLTDLQVGRINELGDTFQLAGKAIEIVGQKLIAELAPALTEVAGGFIDFLASLDIQAVAATASSVIRGIGSALEFVYTIASALSPLFGVIAQGIQLVADSISGVLGFVSGLINQLRGVASAAQTAAKDSSRLAKSSSASINSTYGSQEEAAQKAAEEARKAADKARGDANAAIQRMTIEQDFGGDSQRFAAAQAVEAIQQDILRTEQEIADARKVGNQDAIDAGTKRLAQLDQALARERDVASGARKAAEERIKLEEKYAKARAAFDERRLAALAKPSTELLQLEDTRTASGYAALQRFSNDQADDPAIQEYRKQLKELQAIRRELKGAGDNIETVDILGG